MNFVGTFSSRKKYIQKNSNYGNFQIGAAKQDTIKSSSSKLLIFQAYGIQGLEDGLLC
jgi:hypothetical protein